MNRRIPFNAPVFLAVIAAVAFIPLYFGLSPAAFAASGAIAIGAALMVEPLPVGFINTWRHPMAGDVGTEIKQQILAEIKSAKEEQKKATDDISAQIKKITDEQTNVGKVSEETKGELGKLSEKLAESNARLSELEQKLVAPPGNDKGGKEKSIGEKFVGSEVLSDFIKRGGKGHSQKLDVKTITSVGGSAGAGAWSDRLAGVVEDPLRPVTVRQLLDNGTTGSNLIEWVREDVFTNNAGPTSEGQLKNESDIKYVREDVPVRTLTHFIRATNQILADFPMLQSMINGRLTEGLKIVEDAQLLNGDGTGENLLGLIPQATEYNTALNALVPTSGNNKVDMLRRAILQVWQSYYTASGIVLNPIDWAGIELTKDQQDRYLFGSPAAGTPPTLWGLPIAQSWELEQGQFLVGSFKLGATVFDREQAGIYVSTEDRDNFIRNMVTVLAEERLALAVSRRKAFVVGDFA